MSGPCLTGRWWTGRWLAGLLLAGLWLLAGNALAQRVEGDRAVAQGAYQAEVPVRNQTDGERDKAFARALLQVLGNVTGDRGAAARAGVREELAKARAYVDGYDYRQDEGVSASGAPSFQTILVVRFRQADVDDLVAMLGLPSWPLPHPKPVLWLGIDDGSGPRLVGLGQVNAARAALDQAKARGYALGLPAGNAAEQAAIGAIWRGDTAAVTALSKRYSPPMQLIGKLRRSGVGWVADWVFVDNGKTLGNWQTSDADARRAMAGGADGAADALFKRYARAGSGGSPGLYRVRILGVRTADDYLRLAGYLGSMSIVRRVVPVTASRDVLELDLELATGIGNFSKYANRGTVLSQTNAEDGDASQVASFLLSGG
ncbi:MAG: DUF2066 domain-containing protein [Xanthomonadaceae bacterium]|nr:DUF2066 domain-containing protein [Xanthomonadaceae bacterium]